MQPIKTLLRAYPQNSNEIREKTLTWAEDGKLDVVYELALQLLELINTRTNLIKEVDKSLNHIQEVLSLTKGKPYLEIALKLSTKQTDKHRRKVACQLAQAQDKELLLEVINHHKKENEYKDISALIIHEMVVRRIELNIADELHWLSSWMDEIEHPLRRLPLVSFDWEREMSMYLPRFGIGRAMAPMPFGPRHKGGWLDKENEPNSKIQNFREITNSESHDAMLSAFQTWFHDSNGKAEAHIFALETLNENWLSKKQFLNYKLECTVGQTNDDIIFLESNSAQVFNILFSAACNGGAYGSGMYGAYGRLNAWKSLAGLLGIESNFSSKELDYCVQQSNWALFETRNWFYRIAWDVGIMVLHPEQKKLSIVAVTDTN